VLNIIVPVFDLARSYGNVRSGKGLKKSGNLYSKLCENPGCCCFPICAHFDRFMYWVFVFHIAEVFSK